MEHRPTNQTTPHTGNTLDDNENQYPPPQSTDTHDFMWAVPAYIPRFTPPPHTTASLTEQNKQNSPSKTMNTHSQSL